MKDREDTPLYQETEKQACALRIMEALSGVDEELLERSCGSAGKGKRRSRQSGGKGYKGIRQHAAAWAAVLCLAVVGAASWGGYSLTKQVNDESQAGGAAGGNGMLPEGVDITAGEGGAYAEGGADGRMENGGEEQKNKDNDRMSQQSDGGAECAKNQLSEGMEGGGSATGEGNVQEAQTGEERRSGGDDPEEGAGEESEGTMGDAGCPPAQTKEYKEVEARKQDILGDYVPAALPRGYLFETAYTNLDRRDANLTLVWTRGLDSVIWNITVPEELPETVDVGCPEAYDQRLYEIPHAETVPEEYRESMDHPVFDREDFSLEIVKSRIVSRADAGDTDTPRGNFGVLYSDGVLVNFSGRATAEEIWEMFCSLENER